MTIKTTTETAAELEARIVAEARAAGLSEKSIAAAAAHRKFWDPRIGRCTRETCPICRDAE